MYKPHLVTKGFIHEHGIDYEKTVTPVAQFIYIHNLLATPAAKQ